MMVRLRLKSLFLVVLVTVLGCGNNAALFLNPAFVNSIQGGLFPLVPRPETNLILIRANNSTTERLTFLITIERSTAFSTGGPDGTVTNSETIEVFTEPGAQSNEAGVLFECSADNPITRIGLGRDLNQPQVDAGLFVGGFNDVVPGFGVPGNINPLSILAGDYECGDTIIFRALQSINQPGGFRVEPFRLSWRTQAAESARNTFGVAGGFLNNRPEE
jgi:hypothetical protein